jgi:hypothetical protein
MALQPRRPTAATNLLPAMDIFEIPSEFKMYEI